MNQKLKVLLWTYGFFTFGQYLMLPIYAVFVENIGGDLLTAGLAYGIYALVTGVLIYSFGRWEDRVKHQEKLVVLGYFLQLIATAGYLLVSKPVHLFYLQVLFGIATSINTPAYDSIYSKNLDKGKFASEWGIWESMNWIVTGIGALLGGWVAQTFSWKAMIYFMIITAAAGFFTSLILLKSKQD